VKACGCAAGVALTALVGCADPVDPDGGAVCPVLDPSPSDDPADDDVDATIDWTPVVGDPRFIIPDGTLPVPTQAANNNVAIALAGGRTFVAWRTAPTHFASEETELHVISSPDAAAPWTHEATFALGTDVREPAFLLHEGRLALTFFEAGSNPAAFEPIAVWRAERCDAGAWSAARISEGEKDPWDVKTRGGRTFRTAYSGDHYGMACCRCTSRRPRTAA
jgi:hypothetical protein